MDERSERWPQPERVASAGRGRAGDPDKAGLAPDLSSTAASGRPSLGLTEDLLRAWVDGPGVGQEGRLWSVRFLRGWLGAKTLTAQLRPSCLPSFQTPKTAGLRPMEKKDIPVVHQLLSRYLKQFHLTPVMSQEEVEHWFYPQENIIDTFVVEVSGEGCAGPP